MEPNRSPLAGLRGRAGVCAVACALVAFAACLPEPLSERGGGVQITVYGFSIMKESLEKSVYPAFAAKWKRDEGLTSRSRPFRVELTPRPFPQAPRGRQV